MLLQCIERTIPLCERQMNTSHDLSTIRPGLFGLSLSSDFLPTVSGFQVAVVFHAFCCNNLKCIPSITCQTMHVTFLLELFLSSCGFPHLVPISLRGVPFGGDISVVWPQGRMLFALKLQACIGSCSFLFTLFVTDSIVAMHMLHLINEIFMHVLIKIQTCNCYN